MRVTSLSYRCIAESNRHYVIVKCLKGEYLPMSIKSQFCISVTRASLVLSLTVVAFSGTAYANQCGDISHALTKLGDSYYDVDYRDRFSEHRVSEREDLLEQSDVFTQLRDSRFKNGTGERTRCFGTEHHWRVETSTLELEDIHQQNHSYRIDRIERELEIEAFEYNKETKMLRHESIYFPLNLNTTIHSTAGGKKLWLNTRRRQATEIGSNLRETSVSAISTDTGVDIKQLIYING